MSIDHTIEEVRSAIKRDDRKQACKSLLELCFTPEYREHDFRLDAILSNEFLDEIQKKPAIKKNSAYMAFAAFLKAGKARPGEQALDDRTSLLINLAAQADDLSTLKNIFYTHEYIKIDRGTLKLAVDSNASKEFITFLFRIYNPANSRAAAVSDAKDIASEKMLTLLNQLESSASPLLDFSFESVMRDRYHRIRIAVNQAETGEQLETVISQHRVFLTTDLENYQHRDFILDADREKYQDRDYQLLNLNNTIKKCASTATELKQLDTLSVLLAKLHESVMESKKITDKDHASFFSSNKSELFLRRNELHSAVNHIILSALKDTLDAYAEKLSHGKYDGEVHGPLVKYIVSLMKQYRDTREPVLTMTESTLLRGADPTELPATIKKDDLERYPHRIKLLQQALHALNNPPPHP